MTEKHIEVCSSSCCLRSSVDGRTIGDVTVRNSGVITVATPVILREFKTLALDCEESVEFAPTVITLFAFREAAMERDGALVEGEMDVLCCFACFWTRLLDVPCAKKRITYLLRTDSQFYVKS